MSMNLQEYSKIKADEKFSVLRHKNGSEFKIAHEGLSPEIASRIHKMPMFAGGGMPSLQDIGTAALNPALAVGGSSLGIKNPLSTGLNNTIGGAAGAVTGGGLTKALGGGQQAPTATYAQGLQTPYTGSDAQQAQGYARGMGNQLSDVATQTNGTNGSQQLTTAGAAGQQLGGQLAAGNGVGYQGNALSNQQELVNNLQHSGNAGIANQNAAALGLQNTAGQLQNVANGTGPNPAQTMLNQQTGQNVANQAALMAGQRGAGANAGLIAREAAQQGAATQQQAVGQGATLQAQQQLGALGQLTGANQALAGVGAGQVGQQQGAIGQLANQGATLTGQQQAQNAQNAGIAQNQVGNQIGANTAATQAAQNEQQVQNAAIGAQNQTLAGQQNNINTVNGTLNNTGLQGTQAIAGGLASAAGPGLSTVLQGAGAARGGQVKAYFQGGSTGPGNGDSGSPYVPGPPQIPVEPGTTAGPSSSFGSFLKNWNSNYQDAQPEQPQQEAPGGNQGAKQLKTGLSSFGPALALAAAARGGKVKGLVSEGEVVIPPKDANNPGAAARDVARAKKDGGAIKAASARQKATKPGNSYANDKIEKDLPVGGIVIPRSVMQSKDPVRGAADFVKAVMAKKQKGK